MRKSLQLRRRILATEEKDLDDSKHPPRQEKTAF